MIEEIKKEIEKVLFSIDTTALEAGIAQRQIFEILDKYNNKQKEILHVGGRNGKSLKQAQEIAKYITDNKLVECNINVLEVPNHYKSAWEELSKEFSPLSDNDDECEMANYIDELSQKYHLGE